MPRRKKKKNALQEFLAGAWRGSPLERAAFVVLVLTVVLAPYPWGGVLPADSLKIQLLAFLAATLAFLAPPPPRGLGAALVPAGLAAGILVVGLVQLLPLPDGLLRALSPRAREIWADAGRIVTASGGTAPTPRLTLAPRETAATVFLGAAYLAAFLAAARLLHTRARRRAFLVFVLGAGVAAVIHAVNTGDRLGRHHGPFVNPNHLSGYLSVALAVAFGLLWYVLRRGLVPLRRIPDKGAWIEALLPPLGGALLLFSALAAGIGLSQSRGGILSALLVLPFLVLLALLHRRGGEKAHAVVGVALALLTAALFAATSVGEAPLLRFLAMGQDDLGADGRVVIWKASLEVWRQFPLFGAGLGAFRDAFPLAQPRSFPGLVEQAHSEFLQLLVTGGLLGALLGGAALAGAVYVLTRAYFRQPHREESAVVLSGLAALLFLSVHGTVEFNLSLPAISVTLALALGTAWAASRWREDDEPHRHRHRRHAAEATAGVGASASPLPEEASIATQSSSNRTSTG